MGFKLRDYDHTGYFYPSQEFKMENVPIAREMLSKSVDRMVKVNLFGNGFPLGFSMKEPKMMTGEDYTMVYESVHVAGKEGAGKKPQKFEK